MEDIKELWRKWTDEQKIEYAKQEIAEWNKFIKKLEEGK